MRLHAAIREARRADAWRWAGARLSRVGRIPGTGPRRRLGSSVRIDDDARCFLRNERAVLPTTMADVRLEAARIHNNRPHWTEALQ